MSTEIESPFGNFCRTCMIQDNDADTEFQSIFDAIPNTDKCISDLLNILIECNIVKSMPNRMCGKCVQRIHDVHEFQQMCLRTQSKYRQLTEEKKYTGEIVVPSDLILDATTEVSDLILDSTTEVSDPLEDADLALDENMVDFGKEHLTQDLRPENSLGDDDDFTWPSDEEKDERRTNLQTYECDLCHRIFNKAKSLYDHKYWTHKHKTDLVCGTCGQTFTRQGPFNKHKLKHKYEGTEQYSEKEENQENHSEEQHDQPLRKTKDGSNPKRIRKPPKRKTCEICHKVFANSSNLNLHKRIHTGEKNFLCKECGKSFKCPSTLSQHELRHSGVRQYECPLCPMKFFDSGNLISHKRTHSDIKPHVCDVCGASFKFSYSLNKHKLYHGEKSVKCEQCDMRFYSVAGMRRHLLTHTGEKPYKCKYCERAFNQSNDLMKHLRSHVGNNIYRCELCPMGFPMLKEKRKHFALHKNDDEATRKTNLEALAEYERNLSLQIRNETQIHD